MERMQGAMGKIKESAEGTSQAPGPTLQARGPRTAADPFPMEDPAGVNDF